MADLSDWRARSMAVSLRFHDWRQVIYKHLDGGNCYPNQRLNGFPFPACKAATDSRHVNGRPQFPRFDGQYPQALPERGIPDWSNTILGANSPLGMTGSLSIIISIATLGGTPSEFQAGESVIFTRAWSRTPPKRRNGRNIESPRTPTTQWTMRRATPRL